MCCISWLVELRCSQWIIFWIGTCFPFRLNNIFAVSWLHLGSVVCLLLAAMMSLAAHPRDVAFNDNLKGKSKEFERMGSQFLNLTNKKVELDYLVSRWDGMFEEMYPRGVYQPVFLYCCFIVAGINLLIYGLAIPVMIRNCICGGRGVNFYKNDWVIYKGKVGFGFTAGFSLVAIALMIAVLLELHDVVDVELHYEEYFPYCIRDRYLLDRFCLLSNRETDQDENWCPEIKTAFENSYICTEYYRRIKSVGLASLAFLFHLLAIAGYAQMSYRPWARTNLKKRQADEALWGELRRKRRKDLQDHAQGKVQIALERKKVKLAERAKIEQEIENARRKRGLDIRLKNVRRRLAHRADRKERKEEREKAKKERRQRKAERRRAGNIGDA